MEDGKERIEGQILMMPTANRSDTIVIGGETGEEEDKERIGIRAQERSSGTEPAVRRRNDGDNRREMKGNGGTAPPSMSGRNTQARKERIEK